MGHYFNFQNLRDFLVTETSRKHSAFYTIKEQFLAPLKQQIKDEKDDSVKKILKEELEVHEKEMNVLLKEIPYIKTGMIRPFELRVSKTIRSNAVKAVCDAYESAISNLKAGNIQYFSMNFKKKTESRQQVEIASNDISMVNGRIQISPSKLKNDCFFSISLKNRKKYGTIEIQNNCDLIKIHGNYYIYLSVPYSIPKIEKEPIYSVCGIDPGVRTFMNIYTPSGCSQIPTCQHLYKLRKKINTLKEFKRIRKKSISRIEKKLKSRVDNMHWNTINSITSRYNIVLYGDIKSHDIVKDRCNSTLNTIVNDIKFYTFKQRLAYKCIKKNVIFKAVPEYYTTQTCSNCGNLHKKIGSNEVFDCPSCDNVSHRDYNAAKNIFMKGLIL
jgi:transposase